MTPKQRAILDALRRYCRRHGFAPTQRELSAAVGMGLSSVQYGLLALERDGRVERRGQHRNVWPKARKA